MIKQDAKVVYTIHPHTENSKNEYALQSFQVNDTGIVVTEPEDGTPEGEWYTFGKVTLGQAVMNTHLNGIDPNTVYDIYAKVTFIGFDGTPYEADEIPVHEGTDNVVEVPAAAGV